MGSWAEESGRGGVLRERWNLKPKAKASLGKGIRSGGIARARVLWWRGSSAGGASFPGGVLLTERERQEEAEAGSARREDPGSDVIPKTVGNHSSGEWGAGAACDLQRVSTLQGRDWAGEDKAGDLDVGQSWCRDLSSTVRWPEGRRGPWRRTSDTWDSKGKVREESHETAQSVLTSWALSLMKPTEIGLYH